VHILFTRFPLESAHGGAEVQTMSLMQGLIARGHTVTFLGSCPTLLVLCDQEHIPFEELDIGPPPVSAATAVSFLWRTQAMRRKLRKAFNTLKEKNGGIDAVCMLSLSEKLLLTPIVHEAGIPVFWIEHDTVGPWLTKNPMLPLLRRLSKDVTTVGVSKLSRKIYLELGWPQDRTVSIPNGIDVTRFGEPAQCGLPRDESKAFNIGCVARLAKEKGIDLLIEAVSTLPKTQLSIVGIGDEQANLEELIQEKQIENRVTIEPRHGRLGDFYRSLDLFVLPSRQHDPFGLVAAEAMSLCIPTIVTHACGIALELQEGEAITVPADDADAMRSAIEVLMGNESLRMAIAEAGRERVLSSFTVQAMVQSYEQLFRTA
jgi:glycosyltransferase involved in cell wall biosynthesis